jgi:hypothetical protein
VGLNSLKSLNLTNGYPNKNNNKNKKNNNNNKVKSKPLELRSRVTILPMYQNQHYMLMVKPRNHKSDYISAKTCNKELGTRIF